MYLSIRFVSENVTSEKPPEEPAKSKPEIEVVMKRETTVWFPCALLCQKMNIADPTKCKEDARKSGPFSLLAHVNPFAGTKQRDKEFEKPIQCEDEVVPNAYVPKPTKLDTLVVAIQSKSINTRADSSIAEATESEVLQEESNSTFIKKTTTLKPTPVVPKTELELSIHQHEKSHPSEKKDIYKAIFESSDEESDDEKEHETVPVTTPAPFVPSRLAEDVNILRNNSPPRGIFAGLSNKQRKSPSPQPVPNQPVSAEEDTLNNLYGPSLPMQLPLSRPLAATSSAPLFVPLKRRHISTSSDSSESDEWVAKDEAAKEKHHRAKSKKSKHTKHKKSKSSKSKKSKKNKKSDR